MREHGGTSSQHVLFRDEDTSLLRQWAVSVLARVWCRVTAGGVMSCSAPAGLVSGEHCCGAVADEPATAQQQSSKHGTAAE